MPRSLAFRYASSITTSGILDRRARTSDEGVPAGLRPAAFLLLPLLRPLGGDRFDALDDRTGCPCWYFSYFDYQGAFAAVGVADARVGNVQQEDDWLVSAGALLLEQRCQTRRRIRCRACGRGCRCRATSSPRLSGGGVPPICRHATQRRFQLPWATRRCPSRPPCDTGKFPFRNRVAPSGFWMWVSPMIPSAAGLTGLLCFLIEVNSLATTRVVGRRHWPARKGWSWSSRYPQEPPSAWPSRSAREIP